MPGPFVTAALFCERLLEERDGVISIVRVVDRTTQRITGIDVPGQMPPAVVTITAFISLKPGDARGRYTLRLRPEAPSGTQLPHLDMAVVFEGGEGDRGTNLIVPMQMQVEEEGLYWFDVLWVDERAGAEHRPDLLTRMPLRVLYEPQRLPPSSGPPG